MNGIVILGILLVALGTGVMLYGSHRANQASQERTTHQVEDQIDKALDRMSAIAAEGDPAVQGALRSVEDQFASWASDFLSSRSDREVEVGRARLESQASDLEASRHLAPYFRAFLGDLRDRIAAVNARASLNINYDLAPLNDDFLATRYLGTVTFSDSVKWEVKAGRQPFGDYASLTIAKQQEDDYDLSEYSAVALSPEISSVDSAGVILIGEGFTYPRLPETVELSEAAFRSFARELLEGELHRLGL